MARPVWSGTVSFGLVTIPVTMVPATREGRVAFHLLHATDHARLRRRMVCPEHQAEVEPAHMVRGFEVEPGNWVAVTDEELDSLEPKRNRNIEISDFVALDAVNPLFFDRPYYLLPAGADKPYRLLAVSLAETNKAGVAHLVMRGRQHLAAVVALDGTLCLLPLHHPNEIAAAAELLPGAKVPAREALAAQNLIVRMKSKFRPGQYADEYRGRVLAMARKREREAGTVAAPAAAEAEAEAPPDLMAALEESLSRARAKAKAGRK